MKVKDLRLCEWCGKEFEQTMKTRRFCSEHCRRRAERYRYMQKRFTLIHSQKRERIGLKTLLRRDKGICQICGEPVDMTDYHRVGKWFVFGLRYPTIDHVIPISHGGSHTLSNVQLAHMGCNCKEKREKTE